MQYVMDRFAATDAPLMFTGDLPMLPTVQSICVGANSTVRPVTPEACVLHDARIDAVPMI